MGSPPALGTCAIKRALHSKLTGSLASGDLGWGRRGGGPGPAGSSRRLEGGQGQALPRGVLFTRCFSLQSSLVTLFIAGGHSCRVPSEGLGSDGREGLRPGRLWGVSRGARSSVLWAWRGAGGVQGQTECLGCKTLRAKDASARGSGCHPGPRAVLSSCHQIPASRR